MSRLRWVAVPLLGLSAFVVYCAAQSAGWRMSHDPPLFLYHGFLMDRLKLVPYRDFWDNNPPGTELFHFFVGRFVGYGDGALRLVDLGLMSVTLLATTRALWALDKHAAWAASVIWGLVYLGEGPGPQRDDVALTLVSAALAVTLGFGATSPRLRAAAMGLLIGIAATVKPPAAIGWPLLLLYLLLETRDRRRAGFQGSASPLSLAASAALGLALPLLVVAGYLAANGALVPFLDVVHRDWPLYTRISGGLATIQSPFFNLYSGYRKFGRLQAWLLPAAAGVSVALLAFRHDHARRRMIVLLTGMTLAYLAYVGIQGKFFIYHWHPFLYFASVLSALCFVDLKTAVAGPLRHLPALAFLAFLWIVLRTPSQLAARIERGTPPPKGGRVDEIAAFLRANRRPGDTVQPLDWTGGVLHAMLIAEAPPATAYLYDYVFYHHVSEPYIADQRGLFLEQLRRTRPRFVIEVTADDKPYVRGKDTTRDFNKLRRFLEQNYEAVQNRSGYVIYERRAAPIPGDGR